MLRCAAGCDVGESVRDERICHYDSDGNVVDLISELRFYLARLINVHHNCRCRIVFQCSQANANYARSGHQILTILVQHCVRAIKRLLWELE